jgi:hypothetical protein
MKKGLDTKRCRVPRVLVLVSMEEFKMGEEFMNL